MPLRDPLNFVAALQFAALYALIRWLVVYAQQRFGDEGMYAASAIAGLTDMDAIALSLARTTGGNNGSALAGSAILLAALSNTLVKYALVLVAGTRALKKAVLPGFAALVVALIIGGAVLLRS